MQENMRQYEQIAPMAGDNNQTCICKGNVEEMKRKLLEMNAVVQQKTAEVAQLRENFSEQNEILNAAANEFEVNKQRMQQEMNELQRTVRVVLNVALFNVQFCRFTRLMRR